MPNFERNLRQTCTYWAPASSDVFGKQIFNAPVTYPCRWEERAELFRNKSGQEVASKSKVFLANSVDLDGYLFLGVSAVTDPTTLDKAYEIQMRLQTPDLRNLKTLYVAML